MLSGTFVLVAAALVAFTQATPVASADKPTTTIWTPLSIPNNAVDLSKVNTTALKNPTNFKDKVTTDGTSKRTEPVNLLAARGGPCSQGTCPDYFAGFDLVYTFTAVPVPGGPGDPPLTIFSSNSDIRVNDCGQCLRKKVGSSLGLTVAGGCYDFTACGRAQSICVDPGKSRAHRIWKDNGHKTCYRMKVEYLGSCGPIKSRIVVHPDGETACNW